MRHLPSVNSHGSGNSHSIITAFILFWSIGKSCAKLKHVGGNTVGGFFRGFFITLWASRLFPTATYLFYFESKNVFKWRVKK